MFGIPFLTAAWWAAKALGARAAVGRFFNGQSLAALAIAAAVVAAVLGGVWGWKRIELGAVAGWQAKLMTSRLVATLRDRKSQREADARAAAERDVLVEQIRETVAHAASLERELARLEGNPVCFPAAIAKELRK